MSFGDKIDTGKSKVRTGSDYVKLTSEHSTIIRILENEPKICWSHFVPAGHNSFKSANGGRGVGVNCLGKTCPVCEWNEKQGEESRLRKRKLFTFNVLDRTPVKTCPKCGAEHYGKRNKYPSDCTCGESLSKIVAQPRNKIQIMQKGTRIASQIAQIQSEFGDDLMVRDITIETRGTGKDTASVCVANQESAINFEEILGKDWESKKYNIVDVVKPWTLEQTIRILSGETVFDVVGEVKK